jgi:hypothetical protein
VRRCRSSRDFRFLLDKYGTLSDRVFPKYRQSISSVKSSWQDTLNESKETESKQRSDLSYVKGRTLRELPKSPQAIPLSDVNFTAKQLSEVSRGTSPLEMVGVMHWHEDDSKGQRFELGAGIEPGQISKFDEDINFDEDIKFDEEVIRGFRA